MITQRGKGTQKYVKGIVATKMLLQYQNKVPDCDGYTKRQKNTKKCKGDSCNQDVNSIRIKFINVMVTQSNKGNIKKR